MRKNDDKRGWSVYNLTQLAQGSPKAAGDVSTYMDHGNSQHVVYRDKDGQIHELYFAGKPAKWAHSNLSEATKAPKAASDPFGFAWQNDKSQRVVYRTEDGSIIELSRTDGDQPRWVATNLTSAAAAPKATGRPTGCVVADDKLLKRSMLRVLYRDNEGQIHELAWAHDQKKWAHNNLTELARAPKTRTDPCCCTFDSREHVAYESDGGKVIELYWVASGDNKGWYMLDVTSAAGIK